MAYDFELCAFVSGERGKLYDAGGFCELSRFGALAVDALARDGDGTMEVVELVCVEANRFLAAPTEIVYPRRITKRDALRALVRLNDDFHSLIRGR
jgi:hypothetical protein